jgi:hemoglobin
MPNDTPALCESVSYQQVESIIHAFYQKLIQHPQLGHFFKHIEDFQSHEKRIADFWWLSMGGKLEQPPKIDMIGKHFPLGIQQQDLETWLVLFGETLGEQLEEAPAAQWMEKALQIASRIKQIVIDHQPMGIQIQDKP